MVYKPTFTSLGGPHPVFHCRVRSPGQIGGSQLSMQGTMSETLSQMGKDIYRQTHNQLLEPIYH